MNYKIVALALFALLVGCAIAEDHHHTSHHGTTPTPTEQAESTTRHGTTPAPTEHSATHAPTQKATHAPTAAAPTQKATHAPTVAPTQKSSSSSSSSGSSSTSLCGITSTSEEPLKILVPLYVYPGSDWDTVVDAASNVKIIAIINPNSGPDTSGPDSSYTSYMSKLTAAGVEMVGYVHTSYGDRAASDVQADVDTYASLYPGLKGIFVDEASASSSELSYYQTLYNYIQSKSGYVNTILNPGTQPDQGYLDAATSIVIFEDSASNLQNNFASWVTCAPSSSEKSGYKYRFAGIAYAESQSGMAGILDTMENSGMGLVYVTDGASGCCTYNTLASYFSTEASTVASMN